ncbi:hypothetical protein QAD02_015863 [Eretmocerus hayati]|uniref:Uncharacterized protein n=1 Tax=Eretmocerus hayati TaxID=131215 RepID=A0ACC2P9F4_9HYME|nr:hypothetical protein QAD02_015863 [Eretmocerus hayati]
MCNASALVDALQSPRVAQRIRLLLLPSPYCRFCLEQRTDPPPSEPPSAKNLQDSIVLEDASTGMRRWGYGVVDVGSSAFRRLSEMACWNLYEFTTKSLDLGLPTF